MSKKKCIAHFTLVVVWSSHSFFYRIQPLHKRCPTLTLMDHLVSALDPRYRSFHLKVFHVLCVDVGQAENSVIPHLCRVCLVITCLLLSLLSAVHILRETPLRPSKGKVGSSTSDPPYPDLLCPVWSPLTHNIKLVFNVVIVWFSWSQPIC